ncbi:MAG: hypothetical protein QGI52_10595, partial [Alphaproteobacteria bacterium]|nr:hypothetical protein [Alphaproteobacteria bacterium]
ILKVAVIVMGILILAGLGVIAVKISQKTGEMVESMNTGTEQAPEQVPAAPVAPQDAVAADFSVDLDQLGLGPGARLLSMDVEEGRLVLRVSDGAAGERVLIVDINSGAVLGEIALPPPGP